MFNHFVKMSQTLQGAVTTFCLILSDHFYFSCPAFVAPLPLNQFPPFCLLSSLSTLALHWPVDDLT